MDCCVCRENFKTLFGSRVFMGISRDNSLRSTFGRSVIVSTCECFPKGIGWTLTFIQSPLIPNFYPLDRDRVLNIVKNILKFRGKWG
jgi:hypothetical protein